MSLFYCQNVRGTETLKMYLSKNEMYKKIKKHTIKVTFSIQFNFIYIQ